MDMALTDMLIHSTVRIECQMGDGKISRGTGFFYQFLRNDDTQKHVPALVTNKHVIENAASCKFNITKRRSDGKPMIGSWVTCELNSINDWIPHPDTDIDLIVLPMANLLRTIEKQKVGLYYLALYNENLPTKNLVDELTAIEPVLMVGYPIGLWDSKNNLPVVRRGITASPYYVDLEGRSEFLIDAACFPGSSGSPVFLLNEAAYFRKDGTVTLGGRFSFLGVLYGGPHYEAKGGITIENIPTTSVPISRTSIPINLGYCIKSNRLLDFEKVIKGYLSKSALEAVTPKTMDNKANT